MTEPRASGLSPLKQALLAIDELQARLDAAERARSAPIAVIGLGCRFPGDANDPASFWTLLAGGVDAVTEVPADRWAAAEHGADLPGARWGAFLRSVDGFDAEFFGIAPREAVSIDPQQRLLLEVAWEALEHAGVAADRLVKSATGVFVGIARSDYAQLQLAAGDATRLDAYYSSGIAHSMASGRLSYVLGLQGPSVAVDTACSSSLVAVHLAVQSLRARECRLALAGGVALLLTPENTVSFARAGMLAADGRCKTFDARADGFVDGEGCGILVLKRLDEAVADGDRILAVIRGSAVNQDGPSGGLTVPNGPAQEAVIRAALADAGVAPAEVGYVEAHGTGTSLGDPIEVRALGAVLGAGRAASDPLWVGSVKTNVGHLEAAAGVAGVIKVVLGLQHDTIPPHLHFRTPNPHLAWDTLPVAVPVHAVPWPRGPRRRIAGVSSFGFSGTNVHLVLEEAPAPVEVAATRPERAAHLLAISARSEGALRELASRWGRRLDANPDLAPADVCASANRGRAHLPHRAALLARSTADLRGQLGALAAGESPALASRGAVPTDPPRIAFLFTGQGAQYADMGRALFDAEPVFRAALERCATLAQPYLERPLLSVLYPGPGERTPLDETAYTQPALFALEYALAELWRSFGVEPRVVLGHSVGEYAAACVAGVLTLEDGVRLIAERGRLMQALPAGGAMAAVFAPEARVLAALRGRESAVAVAAVNGPAHVVISGDGEAVRALTRELGGEGIESRALVVSHAFHSPLMEPMLDAFGAIADGVPRRAPRLTWVSNLTGQAVPASGPPAHDYWRRHVRAPVRFAEGMAALRAAGCEVFVEIGPHPTLLGMGRQCLGEDGGLWAPSLHRGRDGQAQLLESLGALYVRGAAIQWTALDRDRPRRMVSLPTYPFERSRYWPEPARPRRAQRPGEHPLLGPRIASPLRDVQFQSELAAGRPAFLGDHRVHGHVILPGAAYLEMVGAAARQALGHAGSRLEDVTLQQPLVLVGDEPVVTQVVLSPAGPDDAVFQVCSLHEDAAGAPGWTCHVTGRVRAGRPADEAGARVSLDELRRRCGESMTAPQFYAMLAARGFDFGPTFRGVARLWRGAGEALGEVTLVEGLAPAGYGLHPALLDACIQVLAAALPADDASYLPLGIDRFEVSGAIGRRLWSHTAVRAGGSGETLTGDVRLLDDDGRVLGELEGIRLRRVNAEAFGRRQSVQDRDRAVRSMMYELAWRPRPADAGRVAPLAEPSDIAARIAPRLGELADTYELHRYGALLHDLDALSSAYVAAALRDMDCKLRPGERLAAGELAARLGVVPRHHRLFARLLEILHEDGVLRASPGGWEVVRTPQTGDPARQADALAHRHPGGRAELVLVRRAGSALADALRGAADPLQLLFPGGSLADAEALYHDAPLARAFGELVRDALGAALTAWPAGRRLRILEIGAGTGGTTAAVLPALPADRTEYVFTDVSPLFVARAPETFGAHPFLTARPLDIERDPVEQGFEPHGFDVVIAANVLHATADLARTLVHCRRLLAPGGLLLLVELSGRERWVDLTFGLTEGWWRFADHDLRPSYPLLPPERWRTLLAAQGFTDAVSVPATGDGEFSRQALVLARAPSAADARAAEGRWLIVGDAGGVGTALASALRARGGTPRLVDAHDGDPASAEPVRRALDEPLRGIVYLAGLDADAPDDVTGDQLPAFQQQLCGGLLHVVQGLVGARDTARLWVVTRGSHVVDSEGTVRAPWAAPLWGLLRTLALEHPELRPTAIDLDPGAPAHDVDALCAELLAADREDQIALRGGHRHVARLVPAEDAAGGPVALVVPANGLLEGFALQPTSRRRPGPGEVEIEVRAAALNFADVLAALGLPPRVDAPLGVECSGVVAAVGEGVEGLSEGDEVIAIAAGTFRSFVTTSAQLVVGKPTGLGFEEAAGVAVAFVTALLALRSAAGVRAGERVLVHAAAGGVGMAALQVARAAGAQVLATAGSEDKRQRLRALGVADVMDSRSSSFAAAVMQTTAGAGVDVVLNSLTGELIGAGLSTLAAGGRFVEIGKREIWTREQVDRIKPGARYLPVDWSGDIAAHPERIRPLLVETVEGLATGRLQPLPVRAFPMARAAEAFRAMAQARHVGKLVLTLPYRAPVRADATYLVTGGLRGLGLVVARWLVDRGARHLVLMGRQAPTDEARGVVADLEARGARVRIQRGDVGQESDVAPVLDAIRTGMPTLRGVFHLAGVLDDAVVTEQTWPRFWRVLQPKLVGAWALHRRTRQLPLEHFVLFSSSASVVGSAGQANHAAANAFLDALAAHRRALGLAAVSVNWGAWSAVGAAAPAEVQRRIALIGMGTMTPEQGLAALERALDRGVAQTAVLPIDWSRFTERAGGGGIPPLLSELSMERGRTAAPVEARVEGDSIRRRLADTPAGRRRHVLAAHVEETARRVLALPASRPLDRRRPLSELGLDSLMAVELRNRLKTGLELERPLPTTLVFDFPTVDALTDHLAREVPDLASLAPEDAPATPPAEASALDRIEQLSDEEVERLFARHGGREA
jgi:acyl transferase domain-containing protein/NADPH:quinone reductase-like Zn-dependent oxidoreductase